MDLSNTQSVEIIRDRLYWITGRTALKQSPKAFIFCIDKELSYIAFNKDFGPLNMAHVFTFTTQLERQLNLADRQGVAIYHYSSSEDAKKANSAFLICCFQILVLKRSADEAWGPFKSSRINFLPFRDASYGSCTYKCTILDCIRGLEYALKLKWFDMNTFDIATYQHYEKVENGDINVIIPEKFVAFSGPSSSNRDQYGYKQFTPEDYVPIFKRMGVTTVIRLNQKCYEASKFIQNGIKHFDLYFLDGSVPSDEIVQKFLNIAENEPGKIAVHCKAGLGRTATLIGLYAMKHYRIPAAEFIGFSRIQRPGSVLGPQQHYLLEKQNQMYNAGYNSPIWRSIQHIVNNIDNLTERMSNINIDEKGLMSPEDKRKRYNGDIGQGEFLKGSKQQQLTDQNNSSYLSYQNDSNIYQQQNQFSAKKNQQINAYSISPPSNNNDGYINNYSHSSGNNYRDIPTNSRSKSPIYNTPPKQSQNRNNIFEGGYAKQQYSQPLFNQQELYTKPQYYQDTSNGKKTAIEDNSKYVIYQNFDQIGGVNYYQTRTKQQQLDFQPSQVVNYVPKASYY